MSGHQLPLSNVLPETAAELILDYLGFRYQSGHTRCLARKQGSQLRCRKRTPGHLCTGHLHRLTQLNSWRDSIYHFSCLLHGADAKGEVIRLRKFTEPKRCHRCQLTWRDCPCPCGCLDCLPTNHLHIPNFYQYSLTGPYSGAGSARKITAIPCKRAGIYRHHPYNHPNCEYCLHGRPCHKAALVKI